MKISKKTTNMTMKKKQEQNLSNINQILINSHYQFQDSLFIPNMHLKLTITPYPFDMDIICIKTEILLFIRLKAPIEINLSISIAYYRHQSEDKWHNRHLET